MSQKSLTLRRKVASSSIWQLFAFFVPLSSTYLIAGNFSTFQWYKWPNYQRDTPEIAFSIAWILAPAFADFIDFSLSRILSRSLIGNLYYELRGCWREMLMIREQLQIDVSPLMVRPVVVLIPAIEGPPAMGIFASLDVGCGNSPQCWVVYSVLHAMQTLSWCKVSPLVTNHSIVARVWLSDWFI